MDAQIATFKGLSTEDGVINSVQEGANVEPDEGGDEGGEPGQTPPAAKPKTKSAQERIDQAVKRQREAERRAVEADTRYRTLEERLARIEAGGRPLTNQDSAANTPDPNAPDPSKYQYGELDTKFIADLARYETRKEIEAEKAQRNQASQTAAQAEQQKARDAFVEAGTAKYEDFREAVIDTAIRNEWPLSQTVGQLAFESPVGPDILYALASDHAEAKRVAGLSEARQAAWFGALEARISAGSSAANDRTPPTRPAVVTTTKAPPPPLRRVLGGTGTAPQTITPDTTDFSAFEAMAMQKRK